ncbi:hypothetical protein HX773_19690 [Pantoea sp. B9002]|uniref:hypothetical protein n=1 Tax=Pantoea sp. B9002 TaxID=2726979 RepID=UPI0015A17D24|nr:hypothetical protein [Pantoea sp. B9002]NWA63133.1 hypothetical protein [Pantoea sp. B9002]
MKSIVTAISAVLLLSGCVAAKKSTPAPEVKSVVTAPAQPLRVSAAESQTQDYASRIMQCRKELDALQTYNVAKHQQFKNEFDRTAGQLKKYLEVKNGISSDVNDLAMPKYQFAIRDVCFRVKSELATSIIKAA